MARTQAAILNRLLTADEDETEILRQFLSYANAGAPPTPPGTTAATWNARVAAIDPIELLGQHCAIAWVKLAAHRLDRVDRNLGRFSALVWLINDAGAIDALQNATRGRLGAGKLAALCSYFGFPIPNGALVQRMIAGLPCESTCARGCRRAQEGPTDVT